MKNNKILALTMILLFVVSMVVCLDVSKAQVVNPVGIDSGLVGYWRFDENSGVSALDSSGFGNDGSVVGAGWVDGKYSYAIKFDGVNDNIIVGAVPNLYSENFTISFWYLPQSNIDWSGVLDFGGTYNSRNWYFIQGSLDGSLIGEVKFDVTSAGFQLENLNDGDWHNIVMTKDGQNITLFLNSILEYSGLGIGNYVMDNTRDIYFGCRTGIEFSNVTLDDVRLYNRVLSASEISILYNGYSVAVTHDLGSTITPNGTVNVGVDQSQSFSIGALSGYSSWTQYINGVAFSPLAVVTLSGVQSNSTLYVTSQYIGGISPTLVPTPTIAPTPIPSSGSIANYFTNFTPEIQIMLIGVVLTFIIISSLVLLRRKRGFK